MVIGTELAGLAAVVLDAGLEAMLETMAELLVTTELVTMVAVVRTVEVISQVLDPEL